jgi:hypothetical protein
LELAFAAAREYPRAVRLGEILVHAGVIDAQELSAALRQQVVYGGRLGTNVIELGYADADQVARGLASQHQVPAALRRHLERHDPSVVAMVPRAIAASACAVPVAFAMAGGVRRLVVLMRDPGDRAAHLAIGKNAGLEIVPCVAPELLVYTMLERLYQVPRPRRMAHAAHGQTTPVPGERAVPEVDDDSIEIDFDADDSIEMPAALQLVDLDDAGVARDLSQYGHGAASRGRVHEIAGSIWASASAVEGLEVASAATDGIQQAIAAAASTANTAPDLSATAEPSEPIEPAPPRPRRPTPPDLDASIAAIERAGDRDAVDRAVLAYMDGRFGGGLILMAKDGLALGLTGFGGLFDAQSVESIVVPLSVPSAFQRAHDDRIAYVGPPPTSGEPIQERFFKLFSLAVAPREIVVVPVLIRDRVVCLYYGHGVAAGELDEASIEGMRRLAAAAGRTFVSLIKGAKRPAP